MQIPKRDTVLSPERASVNSQGREPLEMGWPRAGSPDRGGRFVVQRLCRPIRGYRFVGSTGYQGLTPLAIHFRPWTGLGQ